MLDPLDRPALPRRTSPARPVEYVVRKDGKPFAILNATPALAERTVAGFARATPAASWSLERV